MTFFIGISVMECAAAFCAQHNAAAGVKLLSIAKQPSDHSHHNAKPTLRCTFQPESCHGVEKEKGGG
ncbi:MAG TPA: hypothetical protein VLF15_11115 [Pseudoxanthomonas sp.]|nr:hypothetical protein [Pseudoxanthomonas sp.]